MNWGLLEKALKHRIHLKWSLINIDGDPLIFVVKLSKSKNNLVKTRLAGDVTALHGDLPCLDLQVLTICFRGHAMEGLINKIAMYTHDGS